eukprot:1328638-Amphidinium_carterae.2
MLTGRSGEQHQSKMVKLLEQLFKCRVDVQCGDGSHNLLRHVAGYVAKASDALQFKSPEALSNSQNSTWRQTYRLLCKKSPLEQELVMEFVGLPMVRHSFTGDAVFAPIPGSKADNSSRHAYSAYQQHLRADLDCTAHGSTKGLSYLQWLRKYRITARTPAKDNTIHYKVGLRNVAGVSTGKTATVAIWFTFELLDIFIGSFAATFLPEMDERRLMPHPVAEAGYPDGFMQEQRRRNLFEAPEGCLHLKCVLSLDNFQVDASRLIK